MRSGDWSSFFLSPVMALDKLEEVPSSLMSAIIDLSVESCRCETLICSRIYSGFDPSLSTLNRLRSFDCYLSTVRTPLAANGLTI